MSDSRMDALQSLKGEWTTLQGRDICDHTMVNVEPPDHNPCQQLYLEREKNVVSNEEARELMRAESVDTSNLHGDSNNSGGDINQRENKRRDEVNSNFNYTDVASNAHTVSPVQGHDQPSFWHTKRYSNLSVTREKTKNSWTSLKCLHSISTCLSVFAIVAVAYMYITRNEKVELISSQTPIRPQQLPDSSALQGQATSRVTGQFSLDKDIFIQSNRTQMRWKSSGSSDSLIVASQNESCIIVSEKGTYGVFSVLTFNVYKKDMVKRLSHYRLLKGSQEDEQVFRRQIFGVPPPDDRNDPESIPNSMVSFVKMEANGRICIYTSDAVMKYIYASEIDNTINIFKL